MSVINKRKRERTAEIQKNLELVYKDGFHRVIIKSDESGRFIGVYYISPNGEYLKNMTDVLHWLDSKSGETELLRTNFNFISKKLSEGFDGEFIIDKDKLPSELIDYVLEKKKSIAPGITTVDNEMRNERDEPQQKQIKLQDCDDTGEREAALVVTQDLVPEESDVPEMPEESEAPVKKECRLEDLQPRPHRPFQAPSVVVSDHHIFEIGKLCHADRLVDCLDTDADEIEPLLKPYCNSACAFDLNGIPRVVFECDICLLLWHTDCTGHRWLTVDRAARLIMCDNCDLLRKSTHSEFPNIFCDVEKLFRVESRQDTGSNGSSKTQSVLPNLMPIWKLCQVQRIRQKSSKTQNTFYRSKITNSVSPSVTGLGNQTLSKVDLRKSVQWKHVFELNLTNQNVEREMQEDVIHVQYTLKNISTLSKIFSDQECQLLIDNKPVPLSVSRITLRRGEIFIPVSGNIPKPAKAVFFTVERNQDQNQEYRNRCEELNTAMVTSFYGRFSTTVARAADRKQVNMLQDALRTGAVQITPVMSNAVTAKSCYKLVSSNCLLIPQTTNSQTVLASSPMTPLINQSTFVKLRQRKQDFSSQKTELRLIKYMKSKQTSLLNLPFLILERILSCGILSTQDKLNCRVTSRVLKCIVDAGNVWRKMVINPASVSGLDLMWDFFRSKNVKKITFLIDFQESFGMEFLLSFISRMKLFPQYLSLDKFTLKFTGSASSPLSSPLQLSVQDILACCKSIKVLSIASDAKIALALSKKNLSSNFLEKLKLKNIQNVYEIIRGNDGNTPNLKRLHCGDWSFTTTVDILPLTHMTSLKMYFGDSVCFTDSAPFSNLVCLENLSISQPTIDIALMNLLINILKSKNLCKVYIKTLVSRQNTYDLCYKLSCCFPKHIANIVWDVQLERLQTVDKYSIFTLSKQIQEILPKNVKVYLLEP